MKRLVLGLGLILIVAACSSEDDPTSAPGLIAVLKADGNISTIDPANNAETRITIDAGSNNRYSQPTWSPDGRQLAFVLATTAPAPSGQLAAGQPVRVGVEAQASTRSAIRIVDVTTEETLTIDSPIPPFYLYWAPDGSKLAFLGNDIPALSLAIVDIATQTVERVDGGQPYYFAWSPDSDRLLSHVGEEDLRFVSPDGDLEPLAARGASFTAPTWVGDSLLYSIEVDGVQALVVSDPDENIRRRVENTAGPIEAELSPGGDKIAYTTATGSDTLGLGPLFVDEDQSTTEVADDVLAFFWSRSGDQLLYLDAQVELGTVTTSWAVWDGTSSVRFGEYRPAATFLTQYLPFFIQYANSLTFFSPDESVFVFAGQTTETSETGIWIQAVEEGATPVRVSDGLFATWSP